MYLMSVLCRLGDQLVSWDGYDGLQSAITGAVSSGLTGSALTHSDIGGYNSVFTLGTADGMYFTRSAELLKRWSEFAAFGSGMCLISSLLVVVSVRFNALIFL